MKPRSFLICLGTCLRLLGKSFLPSILAWSYTYSSIRKHAKVLEEGAPQVMNISDAKIEAAKQEWEGLVLSDDE